LENHKKSDFSKNVEKNIFKTHNENAAKMFNENSE
jgi:hypothetical protein